MLAVVGVMFCGDCLPAAAWELTLAEGDRSQYVIVVPKQGSPSTRYGAEELQRFLQQMTGVTLPIRSDQNPPSEREIVLGQNTHLQQIGVNIDFDALGAEGYQIKTKGHHLIIAGGDLRGTLYGVYGLLEEHLGCRWFTPTASRIPLGFGPLLDPTIVCPRFLAISVYLAVNKKGCLYRPCN